MKRLLNVLSVALLLGAPVSGFNMSAQKEISQKNINENEYKMSEIKINRNEEKIENIEKNIYLNTETIAVGKAWGTGSANIEPEDETTTVDLSEFGDEHLMKHYFRGISISLYGEYFFSTGKNFDWSDYDNGKTNYSAERTIEWDKKEELENWIPLKHVESNKGGYKWGNYYKSWVYTKIASNKFYITIKYEVAAYGVGTNWYWSAGYLEAPKITFIAR